MLSPVKFGFVFLAALVLAAPASAGKTYKDSVGENPAAADIQLVSVDNNPGNDLVTFKVLIGNMPTLTKNAAIEIQLDADRKSSTGKHGFDCNVRVTSAGATFGAWDGKKFGVISRLYYDVGYADGLLVVRLERGECNLSSTFGFRVTTARGSDADHLATDEAPNAGREYVYTMTKTALAAQTAVSVNGPPQAGSPIMVIAFGVIFSDGSGRNLVGVACTATLGGARIAGGGPGGCQFFLPKNAVGKRLVVHVIGKTPTVTYRKTLRYVVK